MTGTNLLTAKCKKGREYKTERVCEAWHAIENSLSNTKIQVGKVTMAIGYRSIWIRPDQALIVTRKWLYYAVGML